MAKTALSFESSSRVPTPCMRLRDIVYVPHRTTAGYVYPGFQTGDPILSKEALLLAGAKEVYEHMYIFLDVKGKR